MSLISFEQAYEQWQDMVNEFGIDKTDDCMMSESWNDYTDGLCKEGDFNDLMYHHCPAWDETMQDGEDAFNYLCDCLGLDPETVARDIEELRAYLDDSEPAPQWVLDFESSLPTGSLSDLLDVYDELT